MYRASGYFINVTLSVYLIKREGQGGRGHGFSAAAAANVRSVGKETEQKHVTNVGVELANVQPSEIAIRGYTLEE